MGTLDTLVGLSDDLGKLDGFVERYTYMTVHKDIVKFQKISIPTPRKANGNLDREGFSNEVLRKV